MSDPTQRLNVSLRSVTGALPPPVPTTRMSKLCYVLVVTVNGTPVRNARLYLSFHKEDSGGLVFKNAAGSNAALMIALPTDTHGRSSPFHLAHSGTQPNRLGTFYVRYENHHPVGVTVEIRPDADFEIETLAAGDSFNEPNPFGDDDSPALPFIPPKPTVTTAQLDDALGVAVPRKPLWDSPVWFLDERDRIDGHLPARYRHHPDLNDPFYQYYGPGSEDRRARANEKRPQEEPEKPDWLLILFLWSIYAFLHVCSSAYQFKVEHWDVLTSAQKEEVQEEFYQWLKPHVEEAGEKFEAWLESREEHTPPAPKPAATTPATTSVEPASEIPPTEPMIEPNSIIEPTPPPAPTKPPEIWVPLTQQAVPLHPPNYYKVGAKPGKK